MYVYGVMMNDKLAETKMYSSEYRADRRCRSMVNDRIKKYNHNITGIEKVDSYTINEYGKIYKFKVQQFEVENSEQPIR